MATTVNRPPGFYRSRFNCKESTPKVIRSTIYLQSTSGQELENGARCLGWTLLGQPVGAIRDAAARNVGGELLQHRDDRRTVSAGPLPRRGRGSPRARASRQGRWRDRPEKRDTTRGHRGCCQVEPGNERTPPG